MPDIFISTKKGKFDDVVRKIKNKKYVIATANKTLNEIFLNLSDLKPGSGKFKKIKSSLENMRGVDQSRL